MLLEPNRFEADVLGSSEPVLVDFFSTDCPPCRRLAPTIDRLAEDGHAVCKVNVQERPDLAIRYGVKAVPTPVVLKGGEEVARLVGLPSERTLREALHRARAGA
jgi:thioredoxin 1